MKGWKIRLQRLQKRVMSWLIGLVMTASAPEVTEEHLDNIWIWVGAGVLIAIAVYTVPILKTFISNFFNWLWQQVQNF
jgi:hypothetical protein